MKSHILVIGETLVDLVPGLNGHEAILGGSPFNVAIGLGRLGARVSIATSISTDKDGQRFKAALEGDHVDLSFTAIVDAPSPTALVEEGTKESGPRYTFTLENTAFMTPAPIPTSWPNGIAHVQLGSFAVIVDPLADPVMATLKAVKGICTTSYDPNIRPMITPDHAKARAAVEERVALVDLVKASEEDMVWLYPDRDPADSMRDWLKRGPKLCILTRGDKGAEAFTSDAHVIVPAPKINVADTVGAGDSLMSSLLFAMDRDGALGAAHTPWTQDAITKWLSFGVKASAYTCMQKGSRPPRLKDLGE